MLRPDLTVANLGELSTVHVSGVAEGANAWIDSISAYYTLIKTFVGAPPVGSIVPLAGSPSAGAAGALWIPQPGSGGGPVSNQFGPLAARPPASAATAGVTYFVTDPSGQVFETIQGPAGVYQWSLIPGMTTPSVLASWAAQQNWFLSLAGDPVASGADAGHPIPPTEWSRRMQGEGQGLTLTAVGKVTVTYDAAGDPNETLSIPCNVLSGTMLSIAGTPTTVLAGTIDTWITANPALNVGWGITTNAFAANGWTAQVGNSLRNTTPGPRFGVRVPILGDQNTTYPGGIPAVPKTAYIPEPIAFDTSYPFNFFSNTPTPFVTGDAFVIESFPTIRGVDITGFIDPSFDDGSQRLLFELINPSNPNDSGVFPTVRNTTTLTYVNCNLGFAFNGFSDFLFVGNCSAIDLEINDMTVFLTGGGMYVVGPTGNVGFGFDVESGAQLFVSGALFVGGNNNGNFISDGGYLEIDGDSAFFNWGPSGPGAIIPDGNCSVLVDRSALYGTNNVLGFQVLNGGKVRINGPVPTLTGNLSGSAVTIDGQQMNPASPLTWGPGRYLDRLSGSRVFTQNTAGGISLQPMAFGASVSLTAAVPQSIPVGLGASTSSTDLETGFLVPGLAPSAPIAGTAQNLQVRFRGVPGNLGTVSFQVFRSSQGAAPVAVPGAVTAALPTNVAAPTIASVNYPFQTYQAGDVYTLVLVPTVALASPLTHIMGTIS